MPATRSSAARRATPTASPTGSYAKQRRPGTTDRPGAGNRLGRRGAKLLFGRTQRAVRPDLLDQLPRCAAQSLFSDFGQCAQRADRSVQCDAAGGDRQPVPGACARFLPTAPTPSSLLTATGGWSKRAFIEGLAAFNDPDTPRSVHQRVGQRAHAGQRGGSDLHHQLRRAPLASPPAAHHRLLQLAVLRAGLRVPGVQLQRPGHIVSGLSQDHRFFMSFTLAGLGNFSPFSGALAGAPR